MPKDRTSENKRRSDLAVTVEIKDPEVVDLFLRYKQAEVMPSNAAAGVKLFTTFLRGRANELKKVEPAAR